MKVLKHVEILGSRAPILCVLVFLVSCGSSATVPIPGGDQVIFPTDTGPISTDQGRVSTDKGRVSTDKGRVSTDKGLVPGCSADQCDIDGSCHANGTQNPNNPCQQCLVIASDTEWSNFDADVCDDGKTCTTDDVCEGGICQGVARDCDDNDVCTEDSCEDGVGCSNESKVDECADDNPCTDNSCDPEAGCVIDSNEADCDDGSACTEIDQCSGGQCVGAEITTEDNNPCTNDGCDPATGPFNTPNTLVCSDGDQCTVGDVCAGGGCQPGSATLDCDDGEHCTDDGCNAATGCTNNPNTKVCDDGAVCTVSDTCSSGSCSGAAKDCNDNNSCTADSCNEPGGCAHNLVISFDCRPDFTGVYPGRGATIQKLSGSTVNFSGLVQSSAGPITSLTINGDSVSVSPVAGYFSHSVQGEYGGNIVVMEATDSFGSTRRRVQSFLLSSEYLKPTDQALKTGAVDPGIGVFISQNVVDDGVHTTNPVDDLATLFEMVLNQLDFNEMIPADQPVSSVASYDIYIKNFDDLYRTVSLTTNWGFIEMEAIIYFPTTKAADIEAKSWLPDVNGKLFLDRIEITADITTDVINHVIVTDLINVNVAVYGLDVDIGWLVNWMVNFFEGYITNKVEEEFEAQLAAQMGPMIGDALGAIAFETTLYLQSIDPEGANTVVDIFADPTSMIETPAGIDLKLRAAAYGGDVASYSNKGVPRRSGCGFTPWPMTLPKASPLEMVVSDDTINVLLYAAWKSGLLEFDAPTSMLGASALLDQGISDLGVTISGMLAPTVSDCGTLGSLEVQIGDLRADLDFKLFGQPASMTIYASLAAEVEVVVEEAPSGSLSCSGKCGIFLLGADCQCDTGCVSWMDCCSDYDAVCVDGSVAQHTVSLVLGNVNAVEMEVVSNNDALIPFEQVILDALNDELVPSIVAAVSNNTMGGFPLPSLDIGGLVDGIPPGTLITLDPQTVEHYNGKIVISGDVQ